MECFLCYELMILGPGEIFEWGYEKKKLKKYRDGGEIVLVRELLWMINVHAFHWQKIF